MGTSRNTILREICMPIDMRLIDSRSSNVIRDYTILLRERFREYKKVEYNRK